MTRLSSLIYGLAGLILLDAPAAAQQQSIIRIFVDVRVPRSTLEIQVETRQPQMIDPRPTGRTGFYNIYEHRIRWPVGGRTRRNDFRVYAKVRPSPSSNRTFYLRLRPAEQPVDIYVFERPSEPRCRWSGELPLPTQPEQIYAELARAEAMLLIKNASARCSVENMQNWTRRWARLTLELWKQTDAIGLDQEVLQAIHWAHENPRRSLFSWSSGAVPRPPEFDRVLAREAELTRRFN